MYLVENLQAVGTTYFLQIFFNIRNTWGQLRMEAVICAVWLLSSSIASWKLFQVSSSVINTMLTLPSMIMSAFSCSASLAKILLTWIGWKKIKIGPFDMNFPSPLNVSASALFSKLKLQTNNAVGVPRKKKLPSPRQACHCSVSKTYRTVSGINPVKVGAGECGASLAFLRGPGRCPSELLAHQCGFLNELHYTYT